MKRHKLVGVVFALVFLTGSVSSSAKCASGARSSYPTFSAQKKWPLHPEFSIRASASFQEGSSYSSPPDEMGLYDLYVELLRSTDGKKIASHCERGALSSDSMSLSAISIDTAPYVLSETTHAFGVRASYGNRSNSNPASVGTITFFGVNEKKIRRLTKTIDTDGHFSEVSLAVECSGTFTRRNVSIALSETSHNGLADIEVSTKEREGSLKQSASDCIEKPTSRKLLKRTLVFDGLEYK